MSTRLTPQRLLAAYSQGVFPMDVGGVIRWFSPDPRSILPLDKFHISKTLSQLWRQRRFEIRCDVRFRDVMLACAQRAEGTWISEEIVNAYCRLHELGHAHSVEAWHGDELAGGLYGVALGGAFFGESMFHRRRDASKIALVALVERLRRGGFSLLDVQYTTAHLKQFGVIDIPRRLYLQKLAAALRVRASF